MQKPHYITVKEFLVDSPEHEPKGIFLLAHGAGKGMSSPFMSSIAKGIAAAGVRVVRFHFPYMEKTLRIGMETPTDQRKVLKQCFSEMITHCREQEKCPSKYIIIGGKTMGARIASMVADKHKVAGVICLGYPFHPLNKPKHFRIKHLKTIETPTLICQGENDPFGRREEVQQQILSKSIKFHWLEKCDNNFKPGKLSHRTQDENLEDVIRACNGFINHLL